MTAAEKLIRWYRSARRDLPWRRTRDPYRIWVSEVMLQQTRVEAALPYYRRFIERFPDVATLAAARLDEVLALWSGLGYYRRARQMHRTARLVAKAGGEFPATVEGLLELPGIGPYTAAAVASLAFGAVVPVLDGNTERVLARLLALAGDPKLVAGRRALLAAGRRLLDPQRPGDGNQALMELGATVCTPRAPRCDLCPLAAECAGRKSGEPESFPWRRPRRRPQRRRRLGIVVERAGQVLLVRRPDDSELLAGFWEIPSVEWCETAAAARALARCYGGRWKIGSSRGWIRHGITHRLLEVEVRSGRLDDGGRVAEGIEAGWFERATLDRLPLSALSRKALSLSGSAATTARGAKRSRRRTGRTSRAASR